MKIETNIETIEIPENLLKIFQKSAEGNEIKKCNKNCDGCKEFDGCLFDFLLETRYELFPGYIYPRDIAEFLILHETNTIPEQGGYPFETEMTIVVNGDGYTVVAYGWQPETGTKD